MTSPFQFTHLTSAHRAAMLAEIGVDSFDELIAQIPESIRLRNPLKLSPALPEWELRRLMLDLAGANASAVSHACFLGAGCYDHYVPAVVDAIAQRGEFLTSYTPYQPEMSQGLLAALYEYTVGVAKIFGQPVVNCSHYDGATALAEAAIMCVSARGQASIIAPQTLWPQHRAVLENYLWPRGISLSIAPMDEHRGELDLAALEEIVQRSPSAAVIVQSPNALGILENIPAIASLCRRHGTRLIVSTNPLLAGIQIPAGEQGADVVVGEGQALGLPMSAGGPHLGMMAVSQELRRWIPGRLVGKVTDLHGRDAFALVYEDREQHVARHRATSNICSNQALNSIRVAAYLALVGDSGLERIARENFGKAHLLQRALLRIPGVQAAHAGEFFNEFLLRIDGVAADSLCSAMLEARIFAGVTGSSHALLDSHSLLVAVTESRTQKQLLSYVKAFAETLGKLRGQPVPSSALAAACRELEPQALTGLIDRELARLPCARRKSLELGDRGEVDVVRHFTNLSRKNFGVDTGPYPLGSCTMKYNPKRNDAYAELPGFRDVHPLQPAETVPGLRTLYAELQRDLAELTGMHAFDLSPAAGAHGELKGLLIARRHFAERGETHRCEVVVPDSAHGTNPATATMVGFNVKIVPTRPDGLIDIDALESVVGPATAVVMLTNPSTLGLFEREIERIARAAHRVGALLYYDGANMNALMGLCRPGDMGFDIMHINVHKTLATPHGGGGPGAGPVGVRGDLARFISGGFAQTGDTPLAAQTKIKAFHGHVGVLVRAYAYIRTMGPDGLRQASMDAILNANYLQARLRDVLPAVFDTYCMHECLLDGSSLDVPVLDLAKRMIDYGIHPPTLMGAGCVYFDRALNAAMLFEPTETESKESLDQMVRSIQRIFDEIKHDRALVEKAPHSMSVSRLSITVDEQC